MSTLSLVVASGQVGAASATLIGSASTAIWMPEAESLVVEPNSPPTAPESPVLSAAIPPTPNIHPPAFIPIPAIQSAPDASPTNPAPQSPIVFTLTITETLTITVPASSPSETSQSSEYSMSEWKAPEKMEDLSSFNISAFSGGRQNLEVVQGVPSSMAASTVSDVPPSSSPSSKSLAAWDDNGSVIQLYYPTGSVNPAQRPVGGAQFYASPLDLTNARRVTLEYSVFFPDDFNWVLGGKMPGLYGGHAGCSGGNAALDCWSTRLMWRKEGKGEMYLYAPKDKQTQELCGDPQSMCDAAYGFSIGRGSYKWVAGGWTTVKQMVELNTPGKQDGCFTLDVNGQRVIERNDIFYRDSFDKPTTTAHKGGGLGGLIGTLLDGILGRAPETGRADPAPTVTSGGVVQQVYEAQHGWAFQATSTSAASASATPFPAHDPQPTAPLSFLADDDDAVISVQSHAQDGPVGFKGLFFSSFFGGHEPRYATPTDQYVWFKGFSMSCDEPSASEAAH
ncbi:hypothetical protein DXG01_008604 [Tephrocybe rancida]|nr:hypothetical protein DXG01_008604 [Tephrocybe rancida]